MRRDVFLKFIKKYFKNNYPVFEYKHFTKYRVNTEVSSDLVLPTINKATKFLLGLHTGEWICFGLRDQHYNKKEERKNEGEEWLEGENHIHAEFRFIKLRNGGSYGLLLYLLAQKYKHLEEFWDVGIALKTEQQGVKIGTHTFEVFPTVGDLFLLALLHPEYFPDLDVSADNLSCPKNFIATLLKEKVASIEHGAPQTTKPARPLEGWHQSKIRKSQLIQENDAREIKGFIEDRQTSMIGIMFTDIQGFTNITEKLGGAGAASLVKAHDRIIDGCIEQDGDARFIKKIGDSFMVTFSKPTAAVKTALAIQEKFYHFNQHDNVSGFDIKVRIGIHMGEVAVDDRHGWDVFGRDVNIASRIEGLASGGQILFSHIIYSNAKTWLSDETHSHLRWFEHGKYHLKGIEEPCDIFEVSAPGLYRTRKPEKNDPAQKLVLLVDDEKLYRDKYRSIIENDTDFDVLLANDGDEGLEKVEQFQPKVVVSDLLMPPGEWGGVTLLKNIKEKFPEIEVIILSSAGHLQKVRDVLKMGAYDYLEKIEQDDTVGQIVFEAMA